MPQFSVEEVQRKVASCAEIEGCRSIYLEEIFDWSDYYAEVCQDEPSSPEAIAVRNELCELWFAYANYEITLRQFRKAQEVFEKATNDPVISTESRIHLLYAEYCISRGKEGSAQKVLVAALCKGLQEEHNIALWRYFLRLLRKSKNSPDLTPKELYEAVSSLPDIANLAQLPSSDSFKDLETEEISLTGTVAKQLDIAESKYSEEDKVSISGSKPASKLTTESAKIVTIPSIFPQGPLEDFEALQGRTTEQLLHVFRCRPPMLFSAPSKEPLVSGISMLSPAEKQELEIYLGTTLKDLEDENQGSSVLNFAAKQYLDVLEGLFYTQALKERHFDAWMSALRNRHIAEEQEMDRQIQIQIQQGRAVPHMIQSEKLNQKSLFESQRQLLQALINKTLFEILLEQQKILAALNFPRFSADFVRFVESCARTPGNSSILAAGAGSALESLQLVSEVSRQRKLVCALLSVRLHGLEKFRSHGISKGKLTRESSVDSSGDSSSGADEFESPGKRSRRRRRTIDQANLDSYGGSMSGVAYNHPDNHDTEFQHESIPLLQKLATMIQEGS